MRSWRGKRADVELEAELRTNRPEPSAQLVHRIEGRIENQGRTSRAGSFRIAFAGAIAAAVLTALAAVGGLGYAATATTNVVDQAKRIVQKHGVAVVHKTAARDQYGKPNKKKVKGKKKSKKKRRGARFGRPPFTG